MKNTLVFLFLTLILIGSVLAAAKEPYNLEVRTLYSAPDETSNVMYKIPIEVKLLDVSADANWHKVKIGFAFGPLSYTYVGWVKIPVGEILAARMEKVAKTQGPAEQ
ncbi:hypothetical protein A2625_04545 [candidate division WOR-1 bacterium RIFCSPHIGHO2_01_FULL_53_15]|uniref:SH3b domain-containing protein n=1 Tax=candidate division WOR-1 bacterium RIFCSPHIGHO2_01_FULL_53_15 TaxID=1802564 RepID=A0A1F4PZ86_UNCSA|nr:MAG: hypothetical protein A2625_04545 [candidate division WOR-1 bacterium RIFCSPHIGHO2_01_FULL_53_15]OGC10606.1 MAG: hypothetical protein A3D23_03765 [candidate division WOR-1 bacterium RIFCSPHIGHO2_02_FULL_53_26]